LANSTYVIRLARDADSCAIRTLVYGARLNPTGLDWRRFIVAVDTEETVIGCVQIKQHRDGSKEMASLVVAEHWQRLGVGQALIEHVLTEESPPIFLMCRSSMGPYYDRFGFESIEVKDMPPFFRRISRLARVIEPLREEGETLLVMRRE
jgi:amino-acid N-acetyltransferase